MLKRRATLLSPLLRWKIASIRLLLYGVLFLNIEVAAQERPFIFKHYTTDNGLSNSYINCIAQDKTGFIWIGTDDGLNKFDGYQFKIYRNDPLDSLSLKSNLINTMVVDYSGHLLVGTQNGLLSYIPEKDAFTPYKLKGAEDIPVNQMIMFLYCDSQNNLWLSSPGMGLIHIDQGLGEFEIYNNVILGDTTESIMNVGYLYEDSRGYLWMDTDKGICYFNRNTGRIYQSSTVNDILQKYNLSEVLSMVELNDSTLLIGTENGLLSYNTENENFKIYRNDPGNAHSISNERIICMKISRDGNIWIGTANGINLFYPSSGSFTIFRGESPDKGDIFSNRISAIFEDVQGNLWIGNKNGALNLLEKSDDNFGLYRFPIGKRPDNRGTYSFQNIVMSILEDTDGKLWLGTNGGGLHCYNRENGSYQRSYSGGENPCGIGDNVVFSMLEDQQKNIWIGNYTSGLGLLNRKTGRFHYYRNDPSDPKSISGNDVRSIIEVDKDFLLVGTNNTGLNLFNKKNGTFDQISIPSEDKYRLMSNSIKCIERYKDGWFWAGTVWGLYAINIYTGEIVSYLHNNSDQNSLSDNFINAMYTDKGGKIWIGTRSGLNLFDEDGKCFTLYTTDHGLPSNSIQGILGDERGNIWLSTNKGLSKMIPGATPADGVTCMNYDVSDGLQSNEFVSGSSFKGSRGELFFGGSSGMNSFFPDSISENAYLPPVILTDFALFNKSIDYRDPGSVLANHISHTDHITISHRQSFLSFEFAALSYVNSNKNLYMYKLEGFNDEWIENGTERKATFTNLDPGNYVFRVRASNDDGIWSDHEAVIHFTITPPFWERWWAFFVYASVIILIILSLRREIVQRERLRSELHFERLEKDKIREIEQVKSQFFTNISHELRTPLSLIINPLEKMLREDTAKGASGTHLHLMYRNSQRLLFLINQLLDFRKMEKGKLKLSVANSDIVNQVQAAFESFSYQAKLRNIDYQLNTDANKLMAWYDSEKMDKILINLLSNAFKFTADSGTISVLLKITDQMNDSDCIFIEISVEDSGIGIPAESVEKIFERFYQVDNDRIHNREGSGIGLSLVKELVELHHGKITVSSQPGVGSVFSVYIPMGKGHFSVDEITTVPSKTELSFVHVVPEGALALDRSVQEINQADLPLILFVDDHADILEYIRLEYSSEFRLLMCRNGEEGYEMAVKHMPDLIVSDVMMPVMDGIAFCGKIKTEINTCHIPVILLTARTSEENIVEGLETGADDYIMKPFSTRLLKIRIHNIIENRQKLRLLFNANIDIQAASITTTSVDAKILGNALRIVNEQITNPEFDNDMFIREMGMSKSVVYEKLKAITGKTVSEFIRAIRLKTAAGMLLEGNQSVGEILYQVGFNNRTYFSKCFRDEFGMSASEYVANYKRNK